MRLIGLEIYIQKALEANKTLLVIGLHTIVAQQIFNDDKACFLAT